MTKRVLAIVLCLVMTALLLPAGALAADPEAQWTTGAAGIESPSYDKEGTLEQAFAAAQANATNVTYIKLLKDVDISGKSSKYKVNSNTVVVLDLNNKELSFSLFLTLKAINIHPLCT